jgi:hypothetical protein
MMPESFGQFFAQHPVWAVLLVILMGLPIIGAVAWIIMRAFKKPDDPDRPQN